MDYEEAKTWLMGERSMCNTIFTTCDSTENANVLTAQGDAAMTQQAYWVVKAHSEGLMNGESNGGKPVDPDN